MIEFNAYAGYLPNFLSESDPANAVEQIDSAYAHGGGWNEFEGFDLIKQGDKYALSYPNDPPMRERARGKLREETIVLFEYDWVAVIQPDGTHRVARLD